MSSKEKEDDLAASISKTMTVDKLKEDLKNANVSISGVKKKADYVNLYISNGLHNRSSVASSSKAPKSPGKSKSPSVSVSKAEKTKEEEEKDLIASISKTMTIPQLKKEIILADLWYGTKTKAKTKEDFVNIYISNGLHKRSAAVSPEERKEAESKAPKSKAPKSPETSPKSVSKAVKEELIMSLMISGHGIEGLEWDDPTSRIAQFYKNNVRAYSRACVPGIPSIRIASQVRKSIDHAFTIFKNNPGSATQDIMSEYTGQDKNKYRNFLNKITCNDFNNDKNDIFKNKERCGGLITYLSSKQFFFDEENIPKVRSQYKTEYDWNQFLESRGINVSDIRLKITASDGSVTYRNIFNPYEEMAQFYSSNKEEKEPVDIITKFNLAYRHGLEFILKDVLHKEELIGRALKIFKFKEGENRILSITLVQLFMFFELVGIKYVNIIDHSCRSFNSAFKIPIEKREERFKEEQKYIVKPVAFGKHSSTLKGKRSKGKRSKGKRSKKRLNGKLTKSNKLNSKKPNKYSRKM